MIISIHDNPSSDPLSSHQEQQHISDLDLKFSDDTNNQLPNFSIRDYVFGIRRKDITCNWPFSPTSLQLCFKHGVKNLLPPFQSIDSLRNNSSLTRCSLENRLTDEKLVTSFDGKPKNDQFSRNDKKALESLTTKSSASKGDQESQFHIRCKIKSKGKDKPQKPEDASSIRAVIKKSRFVTKVNSGVEHAAPNFESMTSKVCPVCKIFSSSSNTTLNAHIDQCLTGEGTMKWTENPKVNVEVKHRVKPRKMRLMVEIYKTAPNCTIEELDRRNGTSWATNSSFAAQEFQFQDKEAEEKEEEPKRTSINPKVANNEGDVYIDTDGTKVRILSVPKVASSDNHGARKLLKEVKRSKIILGKKEKDIFKKKHHHKYLKLSSNARNLCSPKPQETGGQEDYVPLKVANLGIIRPPWACSKRTVLSKKSSGKNRKEELQCRGTKDLVSKSEKSSSKCDSRTPQNSSDNVDCLLNTKKMKISLSLIKQPSNGKVEFRKETTRVHEGYDNDDDDECPSQHSDHGANTGSKGSKLPSSSKNLSFPAPKFSLKRKFPAVEKFHFKSVNGSSQDSLKEKSRIDEQAKKKDDTRSISSKNSNGDSSVGIQTVNQDEFHVGESVRNETLSSNVPSFMGLSTSFDPEFSKQECDELYQDQICSTNRAPNDVEILENYFQEVEPIPIPGPPGSFLPASPGGEMVAEEEIQAVVVLSSSENQHHQDLTMDRDSMSNSPVSTVSNSRSTSVQDDTCKKPFFIGDMGFTEKGLSHNSFKNDHQPCCCARKEVAQNFQDSYISRKQLTESNRSIPIGFDFKSEMFSPATETLSFPTNKNFASNDYDSPAGMPSKPVLRLMGKNLTVVTTNEDEFRPPQSNQPQPQQNLIFSQYQNGFQSQHFNVQPRINMRSEVDLMPIHGSFMGSIDRYGHGGSYQAPTLPQTRSHHGHNIQNFESISGRNVYNASSSSKPFNEIIIIDDSPEKEADDSMRNDFFKRNHRQMNPSHTMFPPYGGGGSVGSTAFRGGSFQTSLGNNGDLGKWNTG